jgi:hypothetical protein
VNNVRIGYSSIKIVFTWVKNSNHLCVPWFMHIILATWEAEIKRIAVQGQIVQNLKLHLKNIQHKKGLVEWLMW